jgi:translation initiation factor 5A
MEEKLPKKVIGWNLSDKNIFYRACIFKMLSKNQDGDETSSLKKGKVDELKRGCYCMIDEKPCKIVGISKHENNMVHLSGLDLFTDQLRTCWKPVGGLVEVPVVEEKEFLVVDICDGFLCLVDINGNPKNDFPPPRAENLYKDIVEKFIKGDFFNIIILFAMGQERCIKVKDFGMEVTQSIV